MGMFGLIYTCIGLLITAIVTNTIDERSGEFGKILLLVILGPILFPIFLIVHVLGILAGQWDIYGSDKI